MKKKNKILITELKEEITELTNRIDVLEFKNTFKNKKIVHVFADTIKFLSACQDKVITAEIPTISYNDHINIIDDYIEVLLSNGKIIEVYTIENDKIVPVNLNLYMKAKGNKQ
jgi:hypothetical protein